MHLHADLVASGDAIQIQVPICIYSKYSMDMRILSLGQNKAVQANNACGMPYLVSSSLIDHTDSPFPSIPLAEDSFTAAS